MLLEVEKLDILQYDCAAGSVLKVTLDAVIHLVAVGFWVVQTYKFRTSGLDYRYRLLCPGTLEIDLPCYLLFAHATLTEDDAVGICLGDTLDSLFNLPELRAPSRNQRIVKLDYNAFRLRIFADCLDKLLVYRRTLNDVNSSAVAHHRENIHGVIVVHYGNDGEFVALALLPVY